MFGGKVDKKGVVCSLLEEKSNQTDKAPVFCSITTITTNSNSTVEC